MLYAIEKLGNRYKVYDSDDDTTELVSHADIDTVREAHINVIDLYPAVLKIVNGVCYCVRYIKDTNKVEFMSISDSSGVLHNAILIELFNNDERILIGGIDSVDLDVRAEGSIDDCKITLDSVDGNRYFLNIPVNSESRVYISIPEEWQLEE